MLQEKNLYQCYAHTRESSRAKSNNIKNYTCYINTVKQKMKQFRIIWNKAEQGEPVANGYEGSPRRGAE